MTITRLVQFLGPQCTGKSTLAAGLYYTMKKEGVQVELIHEPARRRAYSGLSLEGAGQLTIITSLYEHIMDVIAAGVPWVVVDTHLLAPLLYTLDPIVHDLCLSLYNSLGEKVEHISILPYGERPAFTTEGGAYAEDQCFPKGKQGFPIGLITPLIRNKHSKVLSVPYNVDPIEVYHSVHLLGDTTV